MESTAHAQGEAAMLDSRADRLNSRPWAGVTGDGCFTALVGGRSDQCGPDRHGIVSLSQPSLCQLTRTWLCGEQNLDQMALAQTLV